MTNSTISILKTLQILKIDKNENYIFNYEKLNNAGYTITYAYNLFQLTEIELLWWGDYTIFVSPNLPIPPNPLLNKQLDKILEEKESDNQLASYTSCRKLRNNTHRQWSLK